MENKHCMALVVLQHFWMVMEEEASGMHCSVLEPGLVVKLKKTRICQKMLNWEGFSIPSSKILVECCSLFTSIYTKNSGLSGIIPVRGGRSLLPILFLSPPVTYMVLDTVNSLLMHTSAKTDTQNNWSLPFYIPLSWLSITRIQYVIQSTFF